MAAERAALAVMYGRINQNAALHDALLLPLLVADRKTDYT